MDQDARIRQSRALTLWLAQMQTQHARPVQAIAPFLENFCRTCQQRCPTILHCEAYQRYIDQQGPAGESGTSI